MRAAPPAPRARRRALRPVAGPVVVLAALALVLAGCDAPLHQSEVGATASSTDGGGTAEAGTLDWQACGDLDCATLEAPLDWDDPDGETIELALARHEATGTKIGTLFVNPGGPGASGVDFVSSVVTTLPEEVLAAYDVVGFDPRGVGQSSAVSCIDAATMDQVTAEDVDTSDAGLAEYEDLWGQVGEACLASTGDLLGHVGTVEAAKDLDLMRQAVGDDTLTYLGYSYGSELGATYAALFPQSVGRLVLDGALDPTLSATELSVGQAQGFEDALRAYVTDCLASASTCPLSGDVDTAMAQIGTLLKRATSSPLPTGTDRSLTGALAFAGVAVTLYSQDTWSYLTQGLAAGLAGDGSILLQLSDAYYGRQSDGTYDSNMFEAFWAINCADSRSSSDVADMRAQAAEIEAAAPTVGTWFSWGGATCAQWPVPQEPELDSYAADGAAPILVVGTTNDPATPYAWAQSLAETLSSGVLLTYEGEGHTAYRASNTCIAAVVDAYLLEGTVPDDGTTC